MPTGTCDKEWRNLVIRHRCLESVRNDGVDLHDDLVIEMDDPNLPIGCFYMPVLKRVAYNVVGTVKSKDPTMRSVCIKGLEVMAWGQESAGGNASTVASQLHGVIEIFSNSMAFVALRDDGSMVAWGQDIYGGYLPPESRIPFVNVVSNTEFAFAALSHSGRVATWGVSCQKSNCGGDSSTVASLLQSDITQVVGNSFAFAALTKSGRVITWGDAASGGDQTTVSWFLQSSIKSIHPASQAFAAIHQNGSCVSWGNLLMDATVTSVSMVHNVEYVVATRDAFAAKISGGSVVSWGYAMNGGNYTSVASLLKEDVVGIASNTLAFAAWKVDGSAVSWGSVIAGGDSTTLQSELVGVHGISSNEETFVAIRKSSTSGWAAFAWGGFGCCGGNTSTVNNVLSSGVSSITAANSAYASLLESGRVITWGMVVEEPATHKLRSDVVSLCGASSAFAAIKSNGSLIAWGSGRAAQLPLTDENDEIYGNRKAKILATSTLAFAVGVPDIVIVIDNGWETQTVVAISLSVVSAAIIITIIGQIYQRRCWKAGARKNALRKPRKFRKKTAAGEGSNLLDTTAPSYTSYTTAADEAMTLTECNAELIGLSQPNDCPDEDEDESDSNELDAHDELAEDSMISYQAGPSLRSIG